MSAIQATILGIYFAALLVLSVYGLHRYYLVYHYLKHRAHNPRPARRFETPPVVTVQLPIYNEVYVAERLIRAVCALDYPCEQLEIQVLDDSTDETTEVARRVVGEMRARGHDIQLLHRTHRTGFKAGALETGLRHARGEFIAIFDADFVPLPGFLQQTISFFTNPKIGMVQARWGHLNREYSLLTRIQSIFLDGHFIIEHTARNRTGCFFNFNGTAGVWRRSCIESAGGWQHDTLTEDLDLSYRAQMRGWKFIFLPQVESPAELPVDMNAFKSQQHRWAKGSIQTGKKLLPAIWKSRLPLRVKLEAFFHLSSNAAYVLMVVVSLLMLPSLVIRQQLDWQHLLWLDLLLFGSATFSVSTFYLVSQREARQSWLHSLKYLPLLMSLGIGLCINNARAVLEALLDHQSEFTRTPKLGVMRRSLRRAAPRYTCRHSYFTFVEAALAAYFSVGAVYCIVQQMYLPLPFLALFLGGFTYTASLSLVHAAGGASGPWSRLTARSRQEPVKTC